MAEHFDLDLSAGRTADVFGDDCVVDGSDLFEREFAGEHDCVGELGVEAHSLDVGDVALGRNVHLDATLAGIGLYLKN